MVGDLTNSIQLKSKDLQNARKFNNCSYYQGSDCETNLRCLTLKRRAQNTVAPKEKKKKQ